ncbi:MAG: alpha/beta hydrolase-fold protein [Anaerolineales bacterium]
MQSKTWALFLMILSILLAGCQLLNPALPTQPLPPTRTSTVTVPPIPTLTPWSTKTPTITPTPTNTFTPTPTPPACLKDGGTLVEDTVPTGLLREPVELLVYLPPCYAETPSAEYPALYLIHGQDFDQQQWANLGVTALADEWIGSGEEAPFLIVMPYVADWREPPVFPFGQALVEEVIPYIGEHYQAASGRDSRVVGGISRGAGWAFHLGLKYWEEFSAFGVHSLPVFFSDAPQVESWLDAIPTGRHPRIYLDYPEIEQSAIRNSTNFFINQLEERGIPYTFSTGLGRHDEAYWGAHIEDYLHFYLAGW